MAYKMIVSDALSALCNMEDESVQSCITSPPYFNLRDYGVKDQIGKESTPSDYIGKLTAIFNQVFRVLKPDGTLWINIGDSYSRQTFVNENIKSKDLIGIPWMLAFALRDSGWYLRQDIIWNKPNAMPESVKDRCVKSHEYIFLFSKQEKYYFDYKAIQEVSVNAGKIISLGEKSFSKGQANGSGRKKSGNALHDTYTVKEKKNKRSVWQITTKPIKDLHFAPYPKDLVEPCILASTKEGDTVLDPFCGSGTTGIVCENLGRNSLLIELNQTYADIAVSRISREVKSNIRSK